MTIYGIDISGWQRGINLDQVAGDGFEAVIAKATEGADYTSPAYLEQKADAQRNRLRFMAYHYVKVGQAGAQVDNYERVEPDRGVPVMLDHELNSGGADVLRAVRDEFARRGYTVALIYLPRWYWDGHIGSPDLSGLPPLMASSYGSDQPGYASVLYPGDGHNGWNSYGGNAVEILQFTQRARAGGREIDAWAFRGTESELDALFSANKENIMSDAQDVATQLLGPDRQGWKILGRAVETDPKRDRYLVEAVAVILTQIAGGPGFEGWEQLGDGPDSSVPRRTLVDGVAHVIRQNEQILAALAAKAAQ
ncbi:glycoside hydrolase family 25 protein [Nocardia vinacea]|uniref:glycoside hydrolase family 25 protein n=1 Tax=Nocardia vinacea TaxID=96468 RepID=UPI002E0D651F|nr:glycoside hydrolase family 25 protein [Nocardia vinacea]